MIIMLGAGRTWHAPGRRREPALARDAMPHEATSSANSTVPLRSLFGHRSTRKPRSYFTNKRSGRGGTE